MQSRLKLTARPGLLLATFIFLARCAAQTVTPPESTLFSTVAKESYSRNQITSGADDLWPSC
ncbi:MAG: hypothetical protein WBE41_03175 [Terracidiphilus sp.]